MAEVSALLPRVGDPDERKLRKYRDRLIVSGKGVMAFGAWNVIKWVIYMLFRLDAPMIEAEGLAEIEGFVSVFLLVLLLLDLLLRYKVGKAAVTEGRGGKAGRFYPFIAIVMDAFSVYSFLGTAITNFHTGELGFMEDVAALLVDFSSLVAMTELVISVFAGRRIAARIAAGKAAKEGR